MITNTDKMIRMDAAELLLIAHKLKTVSKVLTHCGINATDPKGRAFLKTFMTEHGVMKIAVVSELTNVNINELLDVITTSKSTSQVLRHYSIQTTDPKSREYVKRVMRDAGVEFDGSKLGIDTESKLQEAVQTSNSYSDVLRFLGLPINNNISRIKQSIKEKGLDTSHFMSIAIPYRKLSDWAADDIFKVYSEYPRNKLYAAIVSFKVIDNCCKYCGIDEFWNGLRIEFDVRYVNYIKTDFSINNLELVCPNCVRSLQLNNTKPL